MTIRIDARELNEAPHYVPEVFYFGTHFANKQPALVQSAGRLTYPWTFWLHMCIVNGSRRRLELAAILKGYLERAL